MRRVSVLLVALLALAARPRAQELGVEQANPSPSDAPPSAESSDPGVNLPPQQFPAVVPLTDDNFGLALGEFPILLVKFYAEGCEGCKRIAPEFAKAGRTMKKYKIPVQFAQVRPAPSSHRDGDADTHGCACGGMHPAHLDSPRLPRVALGVLGARQPSLRQVALGSGGRENPC